MRGLGRRWLHPACIPAQVEGQTDHVGPDEGYAESRVGGQVDHGDAHDHAAHVGDQPDCPHGDASHGRSIPSSLLEPSGEIRSHCRCLGGRGHEQQGPLVYATRPAPPSRVGLASARGAAIDMVGARSCHTHALVECYF